MEHTIVEITPARMTLNTDEDKRPLRYPLRGELPVEFKVGDRVQTLLHADLFADHYDNPKETDGFHDLIHIPSGVVKRIFHSDYYDDDGTRKPEFENRSVSL